MVCFTTNPNTHYHRGIGRRKVKYRENGEDSFDVFHYFKESRKRAEFKLSQTFGSIVFALQCFVRIAVARHSGDFDVKRIQR